MFCGVSEAAAKANSILKWVKVRNRSYKTDIVKIHAGTRCWLLGEGEGVSSPGNKCLGDWRSSTWAKTAPCAWNNGVQNSFMRNVICSKYQSRFRTIYHWSRSDEHMDLKLKVILDFWKKLKSKNSLSRVFRSKQHPAQNVPATRRVSCCPKFAECIAIIT